MSHGKPAKCTGMIAFILGLFLTRVDTSFRSRFILFGSMSTNRGFRSQYRAAFEEERNEIGEVTTSRDLSISRAKSAIWRPAVALETATA